MSAHVKVKGCIHATHTHGTHVNVVSWFKKHKKILYQQLKKNSTKENICFSRK